MSRSTKVAVLLLVVLIASLRAKANEQSGVLFITSIDPDQPGVAALIEETRTAIQDSVQRPTHFDVEYLDQQLSDGSTKDDRKAAEFFRFKYSRQQFALIIAIGPGALRFAEKYGGQISPGVRILAVIFQPSPEAERISSVGVSTIFIVPNLQPTLNVALAQNPGTEQVVLVAGSAPEDKLQLQQAKEDLESYAPKLKVVELTDNTLAQLKSKLTQLSANSVILFLDFTADVRGEEFISTQVLREISPAASRPMYGVFREQIGNGLVGGSVIDMREVGRTVGKAAVRVLKGEKPEDLMFSGLRQQQYVFDARQLSRWGIGYLPPGSTVLNLQESASWRRYKWRFIGLALAVGLEALLIILLLRTNIQRRKAEREQARLLTIQRLESSMAATLLQLPAEMTNAAIDRGFSRFIQFFGIDCISLFEFLKDKGQFRLLHYRAAKGTPLRMSRLKPEHFKWTSDQLLQGHTVVVRTRADVPQEAATVMSEVFEAGLNSFAGVPLKAADHVFGAIFFSSSRELNWEPGLLEELQTIANITGTGLERARAQADLTQSVQLKSAILASLPSLVAVLDSRGEILSVNSSASQLGAGASIGGGILQPGLNYYDLCRRAMQEGAEYAEAALNGLQQVSSRSSNHFEMEYPSRTDGGERWFHISAVPLAGKQGAVVVSHRDVTKRKLAELDLRESETRFRLMADSAPIMIWMSGPDKLRTDFNKCWLDFTGARLEDQAGEGWIKGIHPLDLQQYHAASATAFDSQRAFSIEYRLRRFDGQYRWMGDRGVPRFKNDGTFAGYIGCCVDLTEQKEAELAHAEIGGRLILAQEEERARIARELHDDINQKLGLLAIDIQQLQQRLPNWVEDAHNALAELFERTNRVSGDVQRLSHQLHSSRLDYLGLPAALRRLCDEFSAQHNIQVECVVQDSPVTPARETNLCLFRIAQECLNNTAKHSHATHVRVELECDGDSIRLAVTDNGRGFDLNRAAQRHEPGLGLISMRERLRLVRGEMSIQSQQGIGTTICAVVPLKADVAVMPGGRERKMAG